MPAGRRHILQFFSTQSARICTQVITISHFSKTEICRVLKLAADKVSVTHLGPGWDFAACTSASWDSIQERYNLPYPYVVAFGGGSAHKNIPRLIAAFGQVCQGLPHHLVLIGHLPPGMDLTAEVLETSLPDRIITLGYLPNTHIVPILAHADLFVLPSLYEGFGLPVLEAQQAGVAVACSTAGSLPEVAGDGAIFFDPLSVGDMAEVIHRCLSDADLRSNLRQLSKENATRFSWEKTAKETLAVYGHVYHTIRTS
jgi:glycosyltransferase involved in cell wall biosynthesis